MTLFHDSLGVHAPASPADGGRACERTARSRAGRLVRRAFLLGVFALTDTELTLLGVVSPAAGTSRTELTYDPPAKILALPIAEGGTWTSTSTVSGVAQGITIFVPYTEVYASTVDQAGTMVTPYGAFPSVRIATDLTRTVGFTTSTKRTFAWMAECFGAIANASSQDNETAAEFTDPAEVRRLVP